MGSWKIVGQRTAQTCWFRAIVRRTCLFVDKKIEPKTDTLVSGLENSANFTVAQLMFGRCLPWSVTGDVLHAALSEGAPFRLIGRRAYSPDSVFTIASSSISIVVCRGDWITVSPSVSPLRYGSSLEMYFGLWANMQSLRLIVFAFCIKVEHIRTPKDLGSTSGRYNPYSIKHSGRYGRDYEIEN